MRADLAHHVADSIPPGLLILLEKPARDTQLTLFNFHACNYPAMTAMICGFWMPPHFAAIRVFASHLLASWPRPSRPGLMRVPQPSTTWP